MALIAHCRINDDTGFFSDEKQSTSLYHVKNADKEIKRLNNTLNRILKERGFPETAYPTMPPIIAYTDKKTADDMRFSDETFSSNLLIKDGSDLGKKAIAFYGPEIRKVIKTLNDKIAFQRRCKKNSNKAKYRTGF